jgi:uncharacterized protein
MRTDSLYSSPRFDRLFEEARNLLPRDDPGHDLAHVLRVLHGAERLGREEKAALEILMPAALLHDIVNVAKNHPDRGRASAMAAEEARPILERHDYTLVEIEAIARIISEHGYSAGLAPSSLESGILQDADRLDGLGAIGVMRAFTCGAKMRSRFYHPRDPFATGRALDDQAYSIDHFYNKLFKLPGKMNTESGRREAERRERFMREFLSQLESEIDF